MRDIEKYISPLVKDMFPSFYRDEGALFITFVEAYYEWLESSGQTLFEARNLSNYRNIDKTIDEFIIYFKNKYLPNIQFNVATNKELFIKNSLDFYRAKGTERAVDLYFKLIYGLEARVQYPGDNLFRPSDNTFIKVEYLEIDDNKINVNLLGQSIRGQKSGAVAFADRLIKVKKGSRFVTVLFITGRDKDFITGEQIVTTTLTNNITAKILGSLSSVDIIRSDPNFTIGETLTVVDGTVAAKGKKGKLRVNETANYTGVVNFEVESSGWGYTENAEVIGSDKVITANNITFTDTNYYDVNRITRQFDTVIQDNVVFDVNVVNSSADIFDTPLNTTFEGYDLGGNTVFEAVLVEKLQSAEKLNFNYDNSAYPVVWANTTSGDLIDDIDGNILYKSGDNTVFIEFTGYTDSSTSAEVIDSANTVKIIYSTTNPNNLGNISKQNVLYQLGTINGIDTVIANGTVIEAELVGTDYQITVQQDVGAFRTDLSMYIQGDTNNVIYSIEEMKEFKFGIKFPVGETDNFFKYGKIRTQNRQGETLTTTMTTDTVTGYDTAATFTISSLENTQIYRDFYSNTTIDAMTTSLASTIDSADFTLLNTIDQEFTFNDLTVGGISGISITNPGQGYAEDPFFIIYEPSTFHLERYDYEIVYTNEEQAFQVGEIVQTTNSLGALVAIENGGAQAKVISNDQTNRKLRLVRISTFTNGLSEGDQFTPGDTILGLSSGIADTIQFVNEERRGQRTGTNAIINSPSFSGNGFVTSVNVIDSGFGYFEDEELEAESTDDVTKTIRFTTNIEKQGVSAGYNLNRRSFLSSDKYLQDSDYYQEYSYEVLTSLPFETYKKTLTDVLHVAGTKLFGSYFATVESTIGVNLTTSTTTFDILSDGIFVNENEFFAHTIS